MENNRIIWIDILRGICMLAILLDHTEIYYTGTNIISYNLYVVNSLVIFFFISGYLFYKENEEFCIKKKIKSIIRTILFPYFVFTTIIALPKELVHGNSIDIGNIFLDIILGKASWFIAALVITELIFSFLLWITHNKKRYIIVFSIITFISSIIINKYSINYPWQLNNALQAVLFLSAGYFYHRKEELFNNFNCLSSNIILIILFFAIKVYVYMENIHLYINPIDISNYFIFIIDITICTLLMINICKNIKSCKIIEWTGSHSLIYYFFCGGVPLLISIILNKLGFCYQNNYYKVIIAFIVVYIITSFITWIIYHYFPYLTGRKIKE